MNTKDKIKNKVKRYWKITPFGDKASCYTDEGDIDAIGSWLEGMTVGYGLKVEIVNMDEKTFSELPEFES